MRTTNAQVRSAIATNCTRPYWIEYFAQTGKNCLTSTAAQQPPYSVIQSDVNDGYLHYDALDVNLRQSFGDKGMLLASYTWSHTLDNVDPDATSQNPNDPNHTSAAPSTATLSINTATASSSAATTPPLSISESAASPRSPAACPTTSSRA